LVIEIATSGLVSEPVYQVPSLDDCLTRLRELHPRVCPRQVLGVRIGLAAGSLLGLDLPRSDKRLLAFVEIDGCFADGVSVATGCWFGRRTLRLIDYGKVAATIVDVAQGRAFRLWPHPEARTRASAHVPDGTSRWRSQLWGYQSMPVEQLLCSRPVEVDISLARLV
jgi:formylmethanofuran dehydrogenase subunit E